jgi:hypothetical protein
MFQNIKYFQYDISNLNGPKSPLANKQSLVSWNTSCSGESSTIHLLVESPIKAYFSYQSTG